MSTSHEREAAIFDAAIELPLEQRPAYLDEACGDDAALRRRVESLLKACESQCVFLDSPVCATAVASSALEKPGDTIGRYKLLEQIGEGGCGVVYVAEQTEPVRRRVALKIIKLGMDTRSVIARFEAERQALAMMDHPNIAKVFDAGATETGRPYFVMELVRGLKITDYCDQAKLSTRARLDLFIHVCQAIQHAHQKGIIHRDIKPSNILVTVNDGVPVPKVIDFGIAKATSGQQLTDKTIYTAFEQFIGTPAYMSPEQAVFTSLDIDTRSDIYALGVLLYELLTGKTPFDAKELLAIGLDEMRRTIREQEPTRPSTRLSTLPGQELSTTAQRRGVEVPKLVSELRGDLDWIVMKALEKDRSRRYETASGFASDVQRHLNNEPVTACPPRKCYRLQKMVRRNKVVCMSGTLVLFALVGGFGVSTWMFVKERAARTRAVAAEQAERNLRLKAELHESAEYHARNGYWKEAQAQFARLIEDTRVPNPGWHEHWHRLAALLAYQSELALYQEHCRQSIERLGNSLDPAAALRFSKDCLLLPDSAADFRTLDKLIDVSLAASGARPRPLSEIGASPAYGKSNSPRRPPTRWMAWSVKSLSEYRKSNFESAAAWAEKSLAHPEVAMWVAIQASATLAMARYHLKQPALAQEALTKARNIANEKLPGLHNGRFVGGEWVNVLVSYTLLREATAVVEGNSRSEDETK
jgi:serine/threonine protein kinase